MPRRMCGGQRKTCRSRLSPRILDLEIELQGSGFASRSPALPTGPPRHATRHPDLRHLHRFLNLSSYSMCCQAWFLTESIPVLIFLKMVMLNSYVSVVAHSSTPQVVEKHKVPSGLRDTGCDVTLWESDCLACTGLHFDP